MCGKLREVQGGVPGQGVALFTPSTVCLLEISCPSCALHDFFFCSWDPFPPVPGEGPDCQFPARIAVLRRFRPGSGVANTFLSFTCALSAARLLLLSRAGCTWERRVATLRTIAAKLNHRSAVRCSFVQRRPSHTAQYIRPRALSRTWWADKLRSKVPPVCAK